MSYATPLNRPFLPWRGNVPDRILAIQDALPFREDENPAQEVFDLEQRQVLDIGRLVCNGSQQSLTRDRAEIPLAEFHESRL
jgi:hypothetical protein